MTRRTRWIVAVALLVVLALASVLWIRYRSAPEAARLLPREIEGVIYVTFKPIRAATHFDERPIARDPDYEEFIRQSGFVFERDLDEIAIGIHPAPLESGVAGERRFSEVFVGRYDAVKLTHYLHTIAAKVEKYRDTDVFVIPHEGRTVRAAIMSVDAVAVTNATDAEVIQEMVDNYLRSAIPLKGPWLLRENYRHVPAGSLAWGILAIDTPDRARRSLPLPGGINFTLPQDTVTIASVRYLGTVSLRVEARSKTVKGNDSVFDNANTLLTLFRAIQNSVQPSGADKDVKAFFESLHLEKGDKNVVLSADIPEAFMKKALTEAPASVTSQPAAPTPATDRTRKSTKKK